jgi:hypothetical protein
LVTDHSKKSRTETSVLQVFGTVLSYNRKEPILIGEKKSRVKSSAKMMEQLSKNKSKYEKHTRLGDATAMKDARRGS